MVRCINNVYTSDLTQTLSLLSFTPRTLHSFPLCTNAPLPVASDWILSSHLCKRGHFKITISSSKTLTIMSKTPPSFSTTISSKTKESPSKTLAFQSKTISSLPKTPMFLSKTLTYLYKTLILAPFCRTYTTKGPRPRDPQWTLTSLPKTQTVGLLHRSYPIKGPRAIPRITVLSFSKRWTMLSPRLGKRLSSLERA